MKPGPKKGWADEMRRNVELHKSIALHHQRTAHFFEARTEALMDRIDVFNSAGLFTKLLFILRGGHV